MANSSLTTPPNINEAKRAARHAATGHWMTALARLGYAAKGVVYLLVGVLAGELAIGKGGKVPDNTTALQEIYSQPLGHFLLIVLTIGLFSFALWSVIQAIFDTEGKGRKAGGLVARIGYLGVAVSYAALGFAAINLLTGSGSAGKGADATAQDWTARLLNLPFGVALVVLVGLVALGVACVLFYKAYKATFRQKLSLATLRPEVTRGVIFLGRLGYAALGIVATIIGAFLIVAALNYNPDEAKGLSGALVTLLQQPFGPVLLGIVAIGLMAYGLYSFIEVRYRRLAGRV
ncbi:MAG TPA: DUF1206 domain-containing protein [Ktedonobacterales bacterium]